MLIELMQGNTVIASRSQADQPSFTTFSFTLTGTEADAITDYTDLRLRMGVGHEAVPGTYQISWAQLEIPDAAEPEPEPDPSDSAAARPRTVGQSRSRTVGSV